MQCSVPSCPYWSEATSGCILGKPSKGPDTPPGRPPAGSLVLASLEIGKALADRGRTTFRAQGTCMYPCVRPGDILHIESRTVEEVAVGEIAVCRRPGYLLGHRTIRKGVEDRRPYIVTRPDRARGGDDGPTYDEDVLGIVTAIERRGQRLSPRPQRYPWLTQIYLAARLALLERLYTMRERLIAALARIQRGTLYRRLAKAWLATTRANLSYIVQLPLRTDQTHDLYHPLSPDKLDLSTTMWRGRPVECWRLALIAYGNRQPAAYATFVLRPPECPHAGWWLEDIHVRARYRGIGFEADLIDKADEIFACSGMELQGDKQ
jgi:hypothetical protein